jgi:hypothetical protein
LWQFDVSLQYYFLLAIFVSSYLYLGNEIQRFVLLAIVLACLFIYFSFQLPAIGMQLLINIEPPKSEFGINFTLAKQVNNLSLVLSCVICVYFIRRILSVHWHKLKQLENNQARLLKKLFPKAMEDKLSLIDSASLSFKQYLGVIFVDICNFSEMLEQEKTDDKEGGDRSWSAFYQIYNEFNACLSTIDAYRIKINGDQCIYIIGLNMPNDVNKLADNTVKACKCLQSSTAIPLKIGASMGEVTLGIFDNNHPHFDIWGQTVVLAARLEQSAKANQIIIDESLNTHNTEFNASQVKQKKQLKGMGNQYTYEVSQFISI